VEVKPTEPTRAEQNDTARGIRGRLALRGAPLPLPLFETLRQASSRRARFFAVFTLTLTPTQTLTQSPQPLLQCPARSCLRTVAAESRRSGCEAHADPSPPTEQDCTARNTAVVLIAFLVPFASFISRTVAAATFAPFAARQAMVCSAREPVRRYFVPFRIRPTVWLKRFQPDCRWLACGTIKLNNPK
jgi:hypothetical protein